MFKTTIIIATLLVLGLKEFILPFFLAYLLMVLSLSALERLSINIKKQTDNE